jgi:hypothetical protein
LLLWIPGLKGQVVNEPTSLMYTLPWLLLRGDEGQREHIERLLSRKIGPMLKGTHNAVIAEMIAHGYMRSTLIYPEHKLNFDFRSGKTQVFNTRDDPGEKHALKGEDGEVAAKLGGRLMSYRTIRKALRQYTVKPWKRPEPGPPK